MPHVGRENKSITHYVYANTYAKKAALEKVSQHPRHPGGSGLYWGKAEGHWALNGDRACGELTSDDSFSTYFAVGVGGGGTDKKKGERGQHYLCAVIIQVLEK